MWKDSQVFDAYEINRGPHGFYILQKKKMTFMIKGQIKCPNDLQQNSCITHDTWKQMSMSIFRSKTL